MKKIKNLKNLYKHIKKDSLGDKKLAKKIFSDFKLSLVGKKSYALFIKFIDTIYVFSLQEEHLNKNELTLLMDKEKKNKKDILLSLNKKIKLVRIEKEKL